MRKILLIMLGCFFIFAGLNAQAVTPKKWTFLVYINGNNSLDQYGEINIKQMEQVGSSDQMNIVVQWASLKTRDAKRMLIQKSSNPDEVTSPVLQNLGLVDMGDYRSLENFIQWAVENFPAEHYFIDVWNHGSGWHISKLQAPNHKIKPLNDISFDDISNNHITTEQLGQVMNHAAQMIGHKIDIYGSDACFMSMAEVANEMSDSVDYFVGSEESEPAMGWPYADLLKRWVALPDASPEHVSKILVDEYVKSYQQEGSGKREVTFSALDLNKLVELDKTINALSQEVQNLPVSERAQVLDIANQTRSFGFIDYKDIGDFIKRLLAAEVKGLSAEVLHAVEAKTAEIVVANDGTTSYKDATGIAFWLPTHKYEIDRMERYRGLKFDANTKWSEALLSLQKTQQVAHA